MAEYRRSFGSRVSLVSLVSVAELYTRPAYIIPAYRDLSTLWVKKIKHKIHRARRFSNASAL